MSAEKCIFNGFLKPEVHHVFFKFAKKHRLTYLSPIEKFMVKNQMDIDVDNKGSMQP